MIYDGQGSLGLGLNCQEVEQGEGVRRVEGYTSTSLLSDKAANQKEFQSPETKFVVHFSQNPFLRVCSHTMRQHCRVQDVATSLSQLHLCLLFQTSLYVKKNSILIFFAFPFFFMKTFNYILTSKPGLHKTTFDMLSF